MSSIIDLRSDTVTQPTPQMRQAMAEAPVGDDVYGEDPTVRALEEKAADILERPSGLFVPSGTMGNQIAVHLFTRPGMEVIGERNCHIFNFEMGAMAALSGALPRAVEGDDGILDPADIENAIQPTTGYNTPTGMLVLENSHNLAGGRTTTPGRLDQLVAVGRRHGLPIHLDGARIFNAAVALGVPASRLARGCDTVMFCLSKGLAAPVGSVLVGDEDTILEARRIRKLFGGGMRQAGIIAAAGVVALETMIPRLADDNRRAKHLADQLAQIPGIGIDPDQVDTNIVFFRLTRNRMTAGALAETLKQSGILVHALGDEAVRAVTNLHITDDDIDTTIAAIGNAMEGA
jgi:threonine aldolase